MGRNAFVGACSAVTLDVPPFCLAVGNGLLYGLNLTGLKRHNFSPDTLKSRKEAYRLIFRSGLTLKDALQGAEQKITNSPEVNHFIGFIKNSKRGIAR